MRYKKEKLIITVSLLLAILILPDFLYAQNCKYNKNGFREVPWGHIQSVVDIGAIRKIRGKIFAGNEELFGVQIALYKIEAEQSIFIGSQISDENGNFCFKDLKKGKYEFGWEEKDLIQAFFNYC